MQHSQAVCFLNKATHTFQRVEKRKQGSTEAISWTVVLRRERGQGKFIFSFQLTTVLWFGTRVKVRDGLRWVGRYIPVGIVGLHTLPLLLASLVAHDRATQDNHTHHTGRVSYTNTKEGTLPNTNTNRGYST